MSRPLTDRERCLALEAEVAELRDQLAAYRAADHDDRRDAAYLARERSVRAYLRIHRDAGGARPAAILIELLTHPGKVVLRERLVDAMTGPYVDADRQPHHKDLDVRLSQIRRALELRGWPRSTIRIEYGRGWWIEAGDARRLDAAILAGTTGPAAGGAA